jgi:DNA polymerase III subunit gamma/tau
MSKSEVVVTESLTTKYRPRTLDQYVGQDAVTLKLKGMIKTKSFPSVFLVTGNSGCGKSTISMMLNNYINCETFSACGECESCTRAKHPDLVVHNIGDTRGIDDIRAITQSARLAPYYNKKIIVLDEVHALTSQAASCLLVPLENASPNTIWVLVTTNPEKLLPTIVGRCHRIDLKPINEKAMVKRLYSVAKQEGVDFKNIDQGKESLELLASLTNGQLRDALQLLESVLFAIKSGEKIDPKELMSKYVSTFSVDLDKVAAKALHALAARNLKLTLSVLIGNTDPRALLNKLRWLAFYMLQQYIGKVPQFETYAVRYFNALQEKNSVKVNASEMLMLQTALVQAEVLMNTSPIDPQIILLSAIGDYIQKLD